MSLLLAGTLAMGLCAWEHRQGKQKKLLLLRGWIRNRRQPWKSPALWEISRHWIRS